MGDIFQIQRNQTCVYWGNPVDDGYGGFTFDTPVELSCRWQNINKLIQGSSGDDVLCKATVFVGQDVDEKGMLKLCTLADLTAAQIADPKAAGATFIKRVDKTPTVSKPTRYVWRVWL